MPTINEKATAAPELPVAATTMDYLEFHALNTPQKPAFHVGDKVIPYERTFQDAMRVTVGLQRQGVAAGQVVAVGHAHPYMHWLLLVACENLRAVSVSFQPNEWNTAQLLLTQVDSILCDQPLQDVVKPLHLLDQTWFATTCAMPLQQALQCPRARPDMDEPLRLSRSSGTTAEPKLMLLRRRQIELWIQHYTVRGGFTARTVFLATGPFAIFSLHCRITACLRLGATVAWGPTAESLTRLDVTDLWLLPANLKNLLNSLPENWRKPRALRIYTGGGALSEAMRRNALDKLCVDIINGYGSNETGAICHLDADNQGLVLPGVDVQIVDDHGATVRPGEIGLIGVRTPAMISGYWRQPETTAQYFRNGWFYPGDMGRWVGPRRLQLLGRADDMLNLGGIKKSPAVIEDAFLKHPGVREAVAMTVSSADGVDALLVTLVVSPAGSAGEVGKAVASQLPSWALPLRVIELTAIPRTPNGKVKRQDLKNMLQTQVTP